MGDTVPTGALAREVHEDLGEEVKAGHLVLLADNLFEIVSDPYQEIALYFLIEVGTGSKVHDQMVLLKGSSQGPCSTGHLWMSWNQPTSSRSFSQRV